MLVKILGIADLISIILFWTSQVFDFVPHKIIFIIALYFLIKGGIFLLFVDIASILDVLSGIVIFASIYLGIPWILTVIVTIYLLQKALFSLMG